MTRTAVVPRIGVAIGVAICLVLPEILSFELHFLRSAGSNLYERTCDAVQAVPEQLGGRSFVDVTDQLKINFTHAVGPLGTYFMPEVNGAGGALFDMDGDGDLDIFLVNSGRSPAARGVFPAGSTIGNRLFRQESDGTFSDVTTGSGLEAEGYGVGCATGDVDNDGAIDLYVTQFGCDRLFRNNGNGTFSDITSAAGIAENDYGTCAAFLDYDRDGRLDLIVSNYVNDPKHNLSVGCNNGHGRVTYCGPKRFLFTDARLYHNDGPLPDSDSPTTPHFTDVTVQAGLKNTRGAGFAVVCADFTGDGWIDIYIANDMLPNRLWVNNGKGGFIDEAVLRGAATDGNGNPLASMGLALGDVNRDGLPDLLATHFAEETATFYLSGEGGVYSDATVAAKIAEPTRLHTGWGAAFIDLDHDGHLDLAITNGLVVPCDMVRGDFTQFEEVLHDEIPDAAAYWKPYVDRNLLLRGDAQGRFNDVSSMGGDFCTTLGSGRALVFGDVDNDGDLDLLVTYCSGKARLFRNDIPKTGAWLMVRAVDPALHRDAIGARIAVMAGGKRFYGFVSPAAGYLGSNDLRVHFGLGRVNEVDSIVIDWPDGTSEQFSGGPINRRIVINRGDGNLVTQEKAP